MTLTVLRAGLDTVVVSYGGEIAEEISCELDRLKEVAQGTDTPQPFSAGLLDLLVQSKACSIWRWRLVHPYFSIVARPRASKGGVLAQVKYSSFGLANEDAATLTFLSGLALERFGRLRELSVPRADVCVDVQGFDLTPELMANVVCAASYRATHGTEKQVETFQFGKSTLLRCYNKTAEIAHSGKVWLLDLWQQTGRYDETKDVWRIEFQAERTVLDELGIMSSHALFADPSALLDYGLRWAQLRTPDGQNKTRWPEHPQWTKLREATFDGRPLGRIVRPSSLMSLDRAKSSLIGLASTAGAYFGTTDYLSALQQLSMAAEVHMMQEDTDFAKLVHAKERRILSGND